MKRRFLKLIVVVLVIVGNLLFIDINQYNKNKEFDESNLCIELFLYDLGTNAYYIAVDNYGNVKSVKGKMDDRIYDVISYKGNLDKNFVTYVDSSGIQKMGYFDYKFACVNISKIRDNYTYTKDVEDLRPINYVTDSSKVIAARVGINYYDIQRLYLENLIDLAEVNPKYAVRVENIIFKYCDMSEKDIKRYN